MQKIRGAIDTEFILMIAGFGMTVDDDKHKAVEYIVYYIWAVEGEKEYFKVRYTRQF